MGRKPNSQREQDDFLRYLRSGRDEMNLLEHSISSASTKVDRDTESILFESETTCPETKRKVPQKWEVTFSGKYGRPTAADDDIYVALLKLAQAESFASPRIHFTSGQLIRILGWDGHGRDYKRIQDGMNRLCGVRVFAKNYWYDNASKAWANRNFGIFNGTLLYDRPEYDEAKRRARELEGVAEPRNWVEWSDVMQASFDAGYIRRLDLEVYREISNPVARKLYRYLGKQFWRNREHCIELETLAVEKLGYRSGTPLGSLRRELRKIIGKLQEQGVYGLEADWDDGYGRSEVTFRCTKSEKNDLKNGRAGQGGELAARLIGIGIEQQAALRFEKQHTRERVCEDIEHADFMERKGMLKKSKAGTLFSMLSAEDPWGRPEGFVSTIERAKRKQAEAARLRAKKERQAKEEQERAEREAKHEREFSAFVEAMSDGEREAYAEAAVGKYRILYGQMVRKAKRSGDTAEVERCYRDAMRCLWLDEQKQSSTH